MFKLKSIFIYMKNFKSINDENKIVILLLVIFLFGLLILNINKKSCGCKKKKVIYREKKHNPYVITGQHEIPEWAINVKKNIHEMFSNI